jgi:hypothetical protein
MMKKIHQIRLLILIAVGLVICALAYEKFGPLENQVVVKRLNVELPVGENQIWKFLWNNFANKPDEDRFGGESSTEWEGKFHKYENKLIEKAWWKKLDSNSLKNCLAEVFNDAKTVNTNLDYLPVGAYATKQGTNDVWIIVVKWECFGFIENGDPLGHIRMFAFDAKKHTIIGFSTCD